MSASGAMAFTASAMAIAGKMWPPVPPPDMMILGVEVGELSPGFSFSMATFNNLFL
jgi:hypothetical protein